MSELMDTVVLHPSCYRLWNIPLAPWSPLRLVMLAVSQSKVEIMSSLTLPVLPVLLVRSPSMIVLKRGGDSLPTHPGLVNPSTIDGYPDLASRYEYLVRDSRILEYTCFRSDRVRLSNGSAACKIVSLRQ